MKLTRRNARRPFLSYVVLSNILFFLFLAVIGLGIKSGLPKLFSEGLIILSAWSSTFAFVILYKRIYPAVRFWDFVKSQFHSRLNPVSVLIIAALQILVFVAIDRYSQCKSPYEPFFRVTNWTVILQSFFMHLIRGPLGEELGWRGFAQNALQKKYSLLISSVIIGFFWGLWHSPLWFLTTGFESSELLKYCMTFMLAIISLSVVIGIVYNRSKNLLVPIVIHQLFNFLFAALKGPVIENLFYCSIGYCLFTLILVVSHWKTVMKKPVSRTSDKAEPGFRSL